MAKKAITKLKKAVKKSKTTKKKSDPKPKLEKIKVGMDIDSWEDVCRFHKRNPTQMPDVSSFPKDLQDYMLNMFKACLITTAINAPAPNKVWEPDWNNHNEWKYRLWFEIQASKDKPSGFGFSDTYYDATFSYTTVGSRLLFRESTLALHAAKKFPEVYKAIILILRK